MAGALVDLATLARRATLAGRRALAARGIEVRRTDAGPRRTLPAVLAHYRRLGLAPGTVIDVGVAAGTPELYAGLPDAELLLVEPLAEWRAQMKAATAGRRRPTHIVIAAAGAQAGEIEIAVHRAPVCSSMLGDRRGDALQPRRPVTLERLDDIAQRVGVHGPFVIKADVEGAELEVLKGAPRLLAQTELVLLEVSLFGHIEGAPQFAEVVAWMYERGFVAGEFYDGHNRPLDGSLAIVDIAFVPESGPFRREHAYATPEQAEALYRSWGY